MTEFKNEKGSRRIKIVGFLLGSLAAVVACGNEFAADCQETRTCPQADGTSSGGEDSSGGGADGGAVVDGGAAPLAGSGGRGAEAECSTASDCSNDNPNDGIESCVERSCVAGNPPPRIIAVSPKDGDLDVDPLTRVTLEFSEELDDATVTSDTIRVFDGEDTVEGELENENGEVTFIPSRPLALLAPYRIEVTTAVTDLEGAAILEAFSSTFTVRSGAWTTIDVAEGKLRGLSDHLPMTAEGSVLVAWSHRTGVGCVTAAWYAPGSATAARQTFGGSNTSACANVRTASNDAGVAAVSWSAGGNQYVHQFRDASWLAEPLLTTRSITHLAAMPNGVLTRFESRSNAGATAHRTDAEGEWEAGADVLTTSGDYAVPTTSFDQQGEGTAAWHDYDESTVRQVRIAVSRYSAATGHWSAAETVPGSAGDEPREARGAPALHLAPDGRGIIVWRTGTGTTKLMASYYSPQTGFRSPEVVSGNTSLSSTFSRPSATFDGKRFVAVWAGSDDKGRRVFTSSYDPTTGWSAPEGHGIEAEQPNARNPQLVSDGRGSLLLVWKSGTAPSWKLFYRRYLAGEWTTVSFLPGGSIADVSQDRPEPNVAMNQSGVGAISWGNYDTSDPEDGETIDSITSIRLATLY